MEKIEIIIYEIMENIIYLEYDIDYLIIINYDSKNNSYDFDDIDVIYPNQFNQIEPNYEQMKMDKGYYEPKNKKNKIDIYESTIELLNPKDEDKEENKNEINVRRTKSGKIRNININNEENKEISILKGKNNNSIKKTETKNDLRKTEEENENEENIEELHSGEKIHNVSYNFQNKKKI